MFAHRRQHVPGGPWDTPPVTAPSEPTGTVLGLVGVYDAVGTFRGEIAYWVGARLGRAHCALCEVTHGLFAERSEWRSARDTLPVAFETFHRDDQPDPVRACAGDRAPAVVARTVSGPVLLLGPEELEDCHASPTRLIELVDAAVASAGLTWPAVS